MRRNHRSTAPTGERYGPQRPVRGRQILHPGSLPTCPPDGTLASMERSLRAVYFGTFTLRFSTGLTGGLLSYYLAELPRHGGLEVDAFALSVFAALFFTSN